MATDSLSSILASLFDRHINLEKLDLSGNHLVASSLPTNITSDLHHLLSLNLCFDKLTNLPTELTSLLQNLKELKLCNHNLGNFDFS